MELKALHWAPEELPPQVLGRAARPGEEAAACDITIVGTGTALWKHLTLEVEELLMGAERIYLRHPLGEVYETLKARGKKVLLLAPLYYSGLGYLEIYETIADLIVKSASRYGPLVYALPGNPVVFEITPFLIEEKAKAAGLSCRMVEGMSSLESMFVQLGVDPRLGLQVVNIDQVLLGKEISPWMHTLVFHIGAPLAGFTKGGSPLALVRDWLLTRFPSSHPVMVVKPSESTFRQVSVSVELGRLLEVEAEVDILSTLHVPPL